MTNTVGLFELGDTFLYIQGKCANHNTEYFEFLWNATLNQPAMWMEDQRWFDVWGMAHQVQWTSNLLYGIARFFALGGSYYIFYMSTGGNNYGYCAGRHLATAYAPDTVIDSFLLRHEPKFYWFQAFFHALSQYSSLRSLIIIRMLQRQNW